MEFLLGILLAVVYTASPGPVNLATIQRGWSGGFAAALAVQLGALAGDLTYALMALAGLGFWMAHTSAQTLLGVAGASLLLWLGAASLRQGWQAAPSVCADAAAVVARSPRHNFWTGMLLAVANPYGVAFWLSIDSAMLHGAPDHVAAFLGGFFLGALLVALGVALLVGHSRVRITPWVVRLASYGFGVALIGFGLTLGYATAQGY
jgi:chemosensory pili system protein ChpE